VIASHSAIKDRRVLIAAVGALVLVLATADHAILGEIDGACIAARVVWAAYFTAVAAVATRLSPKGLEWATLVGTIVSAACWCALVLQTGGSASLYFSAIIALPLLFGVLAPDSVRSSVAATVATVGVQAFVLGAEGAPADISFAAVFLSVIMGGIAIVGTVFYRRLRRAEATLSEDRERAVEELAISESRRLKAERMALIGRLSSRIAQEINNPLAFIKSNLEFLAIEHRCDQEAAFDPVVADCRTGLDRIEKIVSALDSFARMDDGGQETCGVGTLIHEASRLASLRTSSHARIQLDIPERLPLVKGTSGQLAQVFASLLLNAADAIASTRSGTGNIEIHGSLEGDRVHVLVDDDGPGVPPEIRPYVFEPFFTTKDEGKGTGLGLALAREYLQRSGGTIQLEERPGGGARFRVTLLAAKFEPAADTEAEADRAA